MRMWRAKRDDEADDGGMVTTFVAVLAFSLLFVAGFVVDGGRLLNRYVEAHDLAGNAARAAAQAVDREVLYAGGRPVISASLAQDEATVYLEEAEPGGSVTVTEVSGDRVTVEVSLKQELMMLPGDSRTVTANASATAQRGVEGA